jgi:EAL domain-containing protein (putative c-di-GMP-specific phosphodiesterase class I)
MGLDIGVAINVSARQLQQPDLGTDVANAMRAYGVPASSLRVEINETALLGESGAADRTVRALKALGVGVAIDNFGTGYSSLGLVRGFSVQAVKIDRSMVSSCPNKRECAAIVQAVGAMARQLGLIVIASGVETEEERRLVASLGCHRAQGNLIGKPSDWSRIAALKETPKVPAE